MLDLRLLRRELAVNVTLIPSSVIPFEEATASKLLSNTSAIFAAAVKYSSEEVSSNAAEYVIDVSTSIEVVTVKVWSATEDVVEVVVVIVGVVFVVVVNDND